ncbi:DUF1365 domain-containing protein [Streptomyces sp. NPDC004111]|uniref:DUF1365 domain-containing protein n=1 Tax=Streptomyces sp. NPDC004111 TaxID=3364690 RepID=UPI0036D07CF4
MRQARGAEAAPAADPRGPEARDAPALYLCTVTHARTSPRRYRLRHRTYMWYVDLDRLPRLPRPLRPLARFDARDHFGGTGPGIRAGLERFLAARGVDLDGGRVTMLAHARVLGYVFNPLSLYWCHGPGGELRCVVAEVHNTYGERHCYLLRPDERTGQLADVAKEFYVSPFHSVDGDYRMRLPEPDGRLRLSIRLDRPDAGPFTAAVHGERRPATTAGLLRTGVRHPLSTLAVSAAIRLHGVLLYLRRVPVQHRPRHQPQEGLE